MGLPSKSLPAKKYLDKGRTMISKASRSRIVLLGDFLLWNPNTQESATLQGRKTKISSHFCFSVGAAKHICKWIKVLLKSKSQDSISIYTNHQNEHWKLIQINIQEVALLCLSQCLSYFSCFS